MGLRAHATTSLQLHLFFLTAYDFGSSCQIPRSIIRSFVEIGIFLTDLKVM